ncbi:MAG: riboflavin biosynthesis protein RibF, partial [Planctomycetes bacterium RBG_13_63_9]
MTLVRLFRNLDDLPDAFRHGAVAIGKFDGVHLGHARIVERLLAAARAVRGPAVAFTFDPSPARILRPELTPPPLCSAQRKATLLTELGVDAVVAYPTDEDFLQLDARVFFDRILRGRLDARAIVEGPDFAFGHNRLGTVERLRQFCDEAGILLEVVDRLELDGQTVSSSRIAELLLAGEVEQVRAMLVEPYRISGNVIRGMDRGARLGYPTANLGQVETLLPGGAIYAGRAW